MSKKVLLMDVDGVVADCSTPIHRFAEKLFRRDLPTPETWTSWEHDMVVSLGLSKEESREFHSEITGSDVAFKIRLYEGAKESIEQLKQAFDLVWVTAPWKWYPAWVPARDHLLEQFNRPIVYTHEKHRVLGDFLVDDRSETIERGGPWRGILFRRPWNSSSKHVDVVESLDEVMRLA